MEHIVDHLSKFELRCLRAMIEEKLTHMYEVDRGNCHFTHEDWIREIALAMTDSKYKENFFAEYQEYVKAMDA